jgi:phage tail-like protein
MGPLKKFFLFVAAAATCIAAHAARPESPIAASRFGISIDGVQIATFSELQGITSAVTPVGTSTGRAMTVVLRRPVGSGMEMNAWHELVILGDVAAARKSASLVMYDIKGDPVVRYHLTDAWPSKIEVGSLKSGNSEVLMETVTLTCEFIQRVSP